MNDLLQQLNGFNFNVQVPVGYVLVGLAVLWGAWTLTRKAIGLVVALVAKVSFAMLGAAALFVGGLAGGGHALGTLASGPPSDKEYRLTSVQLLAIADKGNVQPVLDYAKDRDQKWAQAQPAFVSGGTLAEREESTAGPANGRDYSWPVALLIGSVGWVVVGMMWFFRRAQD